MQSTAHEDRQAIIDQLHHYCRAMDRIDRELGYSVWHEDGLAEYGPLFEGSGHGFVDWACESHSHLIAHSHRLSNFLIRVDGDSAASEAYVNATLRFEEDGQLRQADVYGRYVDRWSRRDGHWAIDRRIFIQDFDDVRDVGKVLVGSFGRRDREDPSYGALDGERALSEGQVG